MATTLNASSSAGLITTADTSTVLQLQTNGTAALTIDASANVGIGTASPATKLHLYGATDQRIRFENTGWTKAYQIGNDQNALSFYDVTASAERMRIDSSGNVGIGYSTPTVKLEISDSTAEVVATQIRALGGTAANRIARLSLVSSGNYTWAVDGANNSMRFTRDGTETMRIDTSGNLLVGATSSPSIYSIATFRGANKGIAIQDSGTGKYRAIYMETGGGLYFYNGTNEGYLSNAGAWTNASDARLKTKVRGIEYGLATVLATQPRHYERVDVEGTYIGFVAQELQEVIPEVVSGDPEKQLGVDYGSLVAVAFKAIQEQQAIITSLTDRITVLEGTTP